MEKQKFQNIVVKVDSLNAAKKENENKSKTKNVDMKCVRSKKKKLEGVVGTNRKDYENEMNEVTVSKRLRLSSVNGLL